MKERGAVTHPPGPWIPPIAQMTWWTVGATSFMDWCARRYGPTFTARFPFETYVFTSEPATIRQIYQPRPVRRLVTLSPSRGMPLVVDGVR